MRCGGRAVSFSQHKITGRPLRVGDKVEQTHAQFDRDLHRGGCAALFDDQRSGVQVRQVKLELIGAVGRVQRRAGDAAGAGHEAGGHFGPIGQDDGHPVIAADAKCVELTDGAGDQRPQCAKTQTWPGRRRDGWRRVRAVGKKVSQNLSHQGSMG